MKRLVEPNCGNCQYRVEDTPASIDAGHSVDACTYMRISGLAKTDWCNHWKLRNVDGYTPLELLAIRFKNEEYLNNE